MTSALLLLALVLQATPRQAPSSQPAAGGPTQAAATEQLSSQLAEAEGRLRTAIATTPDIAAYHESLALVLEREGRLEEALASHREAVRLDSLTFRNRAGLGQLLVRVGRAAEAIPHLQAAGAIDRSSVEVRKALGAALLAQSRREEALVALREARHLDSSDSDIERSIKQAEATAPGTGRPNDVTATEASRGGQLIRQVLVWTFGLVLGMATLALLAPLLAGALVALVRLVRRPPPSAPVSA